MTSTSVASPSFGDLALLPAVLSAVESQGYLVPSPIQAQTIPALEDVRRGHLFDQIPRRAAYAAAAERR